MTDTAPTGFRSKAPKLGLVPGFDGFRGMGMLMVMLVHATSTMFEGWSSLVDCFFVLSGFLITTLLLQEYRSTDGISLRNFYARRAARLFPSVFLFGAVWLLISTVATIVGFEPLSLGRVAADVGAAVTYTYHLFFPVGLAMIEPAVQNQRTMWHLWTLSLEEWFYLVIAGTVLVCVRRRWIRSLGVLMVVAASVIGVCRLFAVTGFFQNDPGMVAGVRLIFMQRPDGLMLGVALAVLNAYMDKAFVEQHRRRVLAIAGVAAVVWAVNLNLSNELFEKVGLPFFKYAPTSPSEFAGLGGGHDLYWFQFGHTVSMWCFAIITFAMVHYWDWWLSRVWSGKWLQSTGRLSYTLYIWHGLPFIIILALSGGEEAPTAVKLARIPVMFLATFLIAIPVYRYVEMPALKLKLRFSSESEVLDRRTGEMVRTDGAPSTAEASVPVDTAPLDQPPDGEPRPARDGAPEQSGAPSSGS